MNVRPISFSPSMIEALLAGRKTQTRRPLKEPYGTMELWNGEWRPVWMKVLPGDLLWVRESLQTRAEFDGLKPSELPIGADFLYTAPRPDTFWDARKRHARFMPRRISRLTLKVTEVRVQRLQDISEDDAIAEGVEPVRNGWRAYCNPGCSVSKASYSYYHLWEMIYGAGAWDRNPWVAAITFEVIRRNVGEVAG